MTELRFTRRIREHAPEPTPQFTQAMEQALERIAREEEHPSRRRLTRRQVVAVVVAAYLLPPMFTAQVVMWLEEKQLTRPKRMEVMSRPGKLRCIPKMKRKIAMAM